MIHDAGLPAGVAGHSPRVFEWTETFAFAARHLRASDAVCVGIYDENHSGMLAEDVRIFGESLCGRVEVTQPADPLPPIDGRTISRQSTGIESEYS